MRWPNEILKSCKSLGRWLCFLLAFSLEVGIEFPQLKASDEVDKPHASESHQGDHSASNSHPKEDHHGSHGSDSHHGQQAQKITHSKVIIPPIGFPRKCMQTHQDGYCAVQAGNTPFDWKLAQVELQLTPHSLIFRQPNKIFQLAKGALWAHAKDQELTIGGLFAQIIVAAGGKVQISLNPDEQLVIRALHGEVIIAPIGQKAFFLPVAYEVRVGKVDQKGKALVDVPLPLLLRPLFTTLLHIFDGNRDLVTNQLASLKPAWLSAVQKTSQLYKKEMVRQFTNEKERLAKLLAVRRRRERANLQMRQLFKKKNYYF